MANFGIEAFFKGVDKGIKDQDPELLNYRYNIIPPFMGMCDFQTYQAYLYTWRFQN